MSKEKVLAMAMTVTVKGRPEKRWTQVVQQDTRRRALRREQAKKTQERRPRLQTRVNLCQQRKNVVFFTSGCKWMVIVMTKSDPLVLARAAPSAACPLIRSAKNFSTSCSTNFNFCGAVEVFCFILKTKTK